VILSQKRENWPQLDSTPEFILSVLVIWKKVKKIWRVGRSTTTELAGEVEEELLDGVGWSVVLWARIRRMRGQVAKGQP
jgi:hypothetical protein